MPFFDKLTISSPDFDNLASIPARFSADGGNEIPAIEISGAPKGTVEFALICHDPDAPLPTGFTHWVLYGIPADTTTLNIDAAGLRTGPNTVGQTEWSGPQPPAGHGVHHYFFTLYALNRPVEGLPTRDEFLARYADAVIEQARTVGLYSQD